MPVDLPLAVLAACVAAAFIAGFVDAVAGGGGLIQLPVLLAALPTGTGPFMLAELYQRDADITSRVILVSTIASLFSLSAYLALAL